MKIAAATFAAVLFLNPFVRAQSTHDKQHDKHDKHDSHSQHGEKEKQDPHAAHSGQDHSAMGHASALTPAESFLLGQSSGTAYQPAAWPMPMLMTKAGQWNLMWMGQAYLVATQQSGPRGADKVYSANWGMLGAARKLGRGGVMLRGMLSLDPATVTSRRYPLLFQTGESAFGSPIIDGQHPHEFLMELSAQYARPLGEKGMFNVYYAPVGEVALGPVAFPHRASAMELPQATLAHHWQDSTHIANNVLTSGISWDRVRIEASGFHGKEPDEGRWNIDMGPMDSWASRLSVFPTKNWMAQVSGGRLKQPEQFHADDIDRITASVHHVVPRSNGNYVATSLIWAQNRKSLEETTTHAVTAEIVTPVGRKNFITGRFEWSQRDELFEYDHELAHEIEHRTGKSAFNVAAYTAGYTRDVSLIRNAQTGIGANFTLYGIDAALEPFYGNRPWGVNLFLRVRLKPGE